MYKFLQNIWKYKFFLVNFDQKKKFIPFFITQYYLFL